MTQPRFCTSLTLRPVGRKRQVTQSEPTSGDIRNYRRTFLNASSCPSRVCWAEPRFQYPLELPLALLASFAMLAASSALRARIAGRRPARPGARS